jgi:hypothetical protein
MRAARSLICTARLAYPASAGTRRFRVACAVWMVMFALTAAAQSGLDAEGRIVEAIDGTARQ